MPLAGQRKTSTGAELGGYTEPEIPADIVRTCPAPTPIGLVRAGDRVTYQTERMPLALSGVVREAANGLSVVLDGGTALGPTDYIHVEGDVSRRVEVKPDLRTVFPAWGRGAHRKPTNPRTPEREARKWMAAVIVGIDHDGMTLAEAIAAANARIGSHWNKNTWKEWRRFYEMAPTTSLYTLRERARRKTREAGE